MVSICNRVSLRGGREGVSLRGPPLSVPVSGRHLAQSPQLMTLIGPACSVYCTAPISQNQNRMLPLQQPATLFGHLFPIWLLCNYLLMEGTSSSPTAPQLANPAMQFSHATYESRTRQNFCRVVLNGITPFWIHRIAMGLSFYCEPLTGTKQSNFYSAIHILPDIKKSC